MPPYRLVRTGCPIFQRVRICLGLWEIFLPRLQASGLTGLKKPQLQSYLVVSALIKIKRLHFLVGCTLHHQLQDLGIRWDRRMDCGIAHGSYLVVSALIKIKRLHFLVGGTLHHQLQDLGIRWERRMDCGIAHGSYLVVSALIRIKRLHFLVCGTLHHQL